jgi:transcription initiation factor TFIIIB Brf1 subunit/transcription initiation factor TFIIB
METITCPYCECRVRVNDVDDEGGVCPECGAIITSSHLVEQDREMDDTDEEAEDVDDMDYDDDEDEL